MKEWGFALSCFVGFLIFFLFFFFLNNLVIACFLLPSPISGKTHWHHLQSVLKLWYQFQGAVHLTFLTTFKERKKRFKSCYEDIAACTAASTSSMDFSVLCCYGCSYRCRKMKPTVFRARSHIPLVNFNAVCE